ncbi:hypothetical protein ABT160_41740, partial [Streptomyces sp. NPDC001941]
MNTEGTHDSRDMRGGRDQGRADGPARPGQVPHPADPQSALHAPQGPAPHPHPAVPAPAAPP